MGCTASTTSTSIRATSAPTPSDNGVFHDGGLLLAFPDRVLGLFLAFQTQRIPTDAARRGSPRRATTFTDRDARRRSRNRPAPDRQRRSTWNGR